MTTTITRLTSDIRPKEGANYRQVSKPRSVGLIIATVGILAAMVALIGNIVVGAGNAEAATTLPWTFGLTTTAFALIQLGIAVVLWGILMKLWLRVDAIREALPGLMPSDRSDATIKTGDIDTPYGPAEVTVKAPEQKPIHKMAKKLWLPMLAMGVMLVAVGTVLAFAWANNPGVEIAAWSQSVEFLGELGLLAGISFLLGTILWAIRTGGGEVQEGLGVAVKTLKMPKTARVFIVFMAIGMMAEITQFVLYQFVIAGVDTPAAWFAWLGPFREFGLGMFLTGITMALVAIGTALAFQFDRVDELIRTGR